MRNWPDHRLIALSLELPKNVLVNVHNQPVNEAYCTFGLMVHRA